jgi:hypothetical protein
MIRVEVGVEGERVRKSQRWKNEREVEGGMRGGVEEERVIITIMEDITIVVFHLHLPLTILIDIINIIITIHIGLGPIHSLIHLLEITLGGSNSCSSSQIMNKVINKYKFIHFIIIFYIIILSLYK